MRQDPVAFQKVSELSLADSMEDFLSVLPLGNQQFLGAAAPVVTAGTNLSIPLVPCAVGDLRIIHYVYDTAQFSTGPAGFLPIHTFAINGSISSSIWGRIKQGGDTDANVVATLLGPLTNAAISYAYTGVNAAAIGNSAGISVPTAQVITPSRISTTANNTWITEYGCDFDTLGNNSVWNAAQPGYTVDARAVSPAILSSFQIAFIASHVNSFFGRPLLSDMSADKATQGVLAVHTIGIKTS